MNKNRYLLCLLLCGFILYYAVPRLAITASGVRGLFSIVWLGFALMVIAGNITALLYAPKKQRQKHLQRQDKQKSRSFYS